MQKKLWSKEFISITASSLFNAWAFYALLPTLPLYLLETLKFSHSSVGLIIAAFSVSVILVRPVAGYLADNYNRFVVLVISLSAATVSYAVYPLTSTVAGIFMIRLIQGAMFGISTSSSVTIVVDIVPPLQMGHGIGIYALTIPLGMTIGPVFGLKIFQDYSSNMLFIAIFIISFIAILFALSAKTPLKTIIKNKFSLPNLFSLKAFPISICMFFVMIAYGAIIVFVSIYAKQKHFHNVGTFFICFSVTIFISRLFAGRLFDKGRIYQLILSSLIFIAIGILCFGYAADQIQFLIAGMINGFGFGMLMPTCQAAVNSIVKSSERGAANSTYLLSYDLGIGVGSLVIGFLLDKISLEEIYRYSIFMIIISAFVFIFIAIPHYYRNKKTISDFHESQSADC